MKKSADIKEGMLRYNVWCVQASGQDKSNLAIYSLAFLLTTLGIVYVQEAERKIPMNYANRYKAGALARQSYLPFKVLT